MSLSRARALNSNLTLNASDVTCAEWLASVLNAVTTTCSKRLMPTLKADAQCSRLNRYAGTETLPSHQRRATAPTAVDDRIPRQHMIAKSQRIARASLSLQAGPPDPLAQLRHTDITSAAGDQLESQPKRMNMIASLKAWILAPANLEAIGLRRFAL